MTPPTTLSVSFHQSLGFAEHALRPTNVNVDFSTEIIELLAQPLPGIQQSKSHSHFSVFRAEVGLLMATARTTKPNDASRSTD